MAADKIIFQRRAKRKNVYWSFSSIRRGTGKLLNFICRVLSDY